MLYLVQYTPLDLQAGNTPSSNGESVASVCGVLIVQQQSRSPARANQNRVSACVIGQSVHEVLCGCSCSPHLGSVSFGKDSGSSTVLEWNYQFHTRKKLIRIHSMLHWLTAWSYMWRCQAHSGGAVARRLECATMVPGREMHEGLWSAE